MIWFSQLGTVNRHLGFYTITWRSTVRSQHKLSKSSNFYVGYSKHYDEHWFQYTHTNRPLRRSENEATRRLRNTQRSNVLFGFGYQYIRTELCTVHTLITQRYAPRIVSMLLHVLCTLLHKDRTHCTELKKKKQKKRKSKQPKQITIRLMKHKQCVLVACILVGLVCVIGCCVFCFRCVSPTSCICVLVVDHRSPANSVSVSFSFILSRSEHYPSTLVDLLR